MIRHFTVSGFVVDGNRTALHWHRQARKWLPPGGHVEPNEDPVQAVLREVLEETGLQAVVVPTRSPVPLGSSAHVPAPVAILINDISDGPHQHINMVYFLRPINGSTLQPQGDEVFAWVDAETLRRREPVDLTCCGVMAPVAADVRLLGLAAIGLVRRATEGAGG